jgi:hypothetical protein
MITARAGAFFATTAMLATGCAKPDPFDDPEYAAACHGPPSYSAG